MVGVDIDPSLIAAAKADHPAGTWLAGDLAGLDLTVDGIVEPFDVIVSAGNVMTFLDPLTRRHVLRRLAVHLAPQARLVVGFGAERGYPFEDFFVDTESVGLCSDLTFSTWDMRRFEPASTFLVAVLTIAERAT